MAGDGRLGALLAHARRGAGWVAAGRPASRGNQRADRRAGGRAGGRASKQAPMTYIMEQRSPIKY